MNAIEKMQKEGTLWIFIAILVRSGVSPSATMLEGGTWEHALTKEYEEVDE